MELVNVPVPSKRNLGESSLRFNKKTSYLWGGGAGVKKKVLSGYKNIEFGSVYNAL